MIRRAKIAFALAAPFIAFFLLGITGRGQQFLRGNIPPNASHWELDDRYMGAGLAPVAYGLVPAVLLCVAGCVFLLLGYLDRRFTGRELNER